MRAVQYLNVLKVTITFLCLYCRLCRDCEARLNHCLSPKTNTATKIESAQSNLVNSKSSGLEVLLRIINSLNYREVGINNMLSTKVIIISPPPHIIQTFRVRKINVSERRFFHAPKTCQSLY